MVEGRRGPRLFARTAGRCLGAVLRGGHEVGFDLENATWRSSLGVVGQVRRSSHPALKPRVFMIR